MSASAEAPAVPPSEDYRRGWSDCAARFRAITDAGRKLGVVEMGVALADTDLEMEVAIAVMRRASPLPAERAEAVDVQH